MKRIARRLACGVLALCLIANRCKVLHDFRSVFKFLFIFLETILPQFPSILIENFSFFSSSLLFSIIHINISKIQECAVLFSGPERVSAAEVDFFLSFVELKSLKQFKLPVFYWSLLSLLGSLVISLRIITLLFFFTVTVMSVPLSLQLTQRITQSMNSLFRSHKSRHLHT